MIGRNTRLLAEAAAGDQVAWGELVESLQGVVWAATFGFRFDEATRSDVFQLTWLRLLDNIDRIRDPERLAGWLATTARRECLAIVRERDRFDVSHHVEDQAGDSQDPDTAILATEEEGAVASAFRDLDLRCRELLRFLVCEPPLSYQEISQLMDVPIGSIGPTRARCLDRLRAHRAIVELRGPGNGKAHRHG